MLILEFEEHRINEERKEIFESCDWWKELVSRAAQDADRFEVRCWEDEQEGIAFGQQYGQKQESSTKEIVFAGELTGQALPAKATFIVAVIQQAFQVLLCKIAQNKTFGGQKFHFNALLFIVAYFFGAKTPQPSISSAMMWERV